jgi:DNA polymerase delta subunit 2
MTASIAPPSTNANRPKRAFATHTPKWQRFQPTLMVPSEKQQKNVIKEVYAYQRQYSHVYSHRLVALKPRVEMAMNKDNDDDTYKRIHRVLELRETVPSKVVGTIIKEANDPDEDPLHPNSKFCRPSDQLFLEDESGRVALNVPNVHEYCTGIVVGAKGTVDHTGTLQVEEVVLPAPLETPTLAGSLTPSSSSSQESPPHLLLVSSLLCGDPNVSSLPREMLASYLQGQFTSDAAKVCRVVLVGGLVSPQEPLQGIQELDAFSLQLSRAGIPLDIVPGKDDPTTANWPQRPLHSSLLPHATSIVHCTPNPYAAAHGSKFLMATDGQNVHDLQQHVLKTKTNHNNNSKADDDDTTTTTTTHEPLSELEALEKLLQWQHLCPTGPDSVPTVPHLDQDPMVMDQVLPHLLVSGNAAAFGTSEITSASTTTGGTGTSTTTLITVPKFSASGEAVLVNLETLQVELLRFDDRE